MKTKIALIAVLLTFALLAAPARADDDDRMSAQSVACDDLRADQHRYAEQFCTAKPVLNVMATGPVIGRDVPIEPGDYLYYVSSTVPVQVLFFYEGKKYGVFDFDKIKPWHVDNFTVPRAGGVLDYIFRRQPDTDLLSILVIIPGK